MIGGILNKVVSGIKSLNPVKFLTGGGGEAAAGADGSGMMQANNSLAGVYQSMMSNGVSSAKKMADAAHGEGSLLSDDFFGKRMENENNKYSMFNDEEYYG
jgi:hypothetical protein